jgi:hypothetical protein
VEEGGLAADRTAGSHSIQTEVVRTAAVSLAPPTKTPRKHERHEISLIRDFVPS